MAVNISAMQLRSENFLESVFAILQDTRLDPRLLELELTESVLMKHAESTASILTALRDRGVPVAVDDFGTGYSSLSYLRKFPIDALKIDQSFVGQITTVPDEIIIVKAVIGLGRSLTLRVVAEGVETQEQLAFLKAHKCDEAQGYYFQPASASRAVRQVAQERYCEISERSLIVLEAIFGRSGHKEMTDRRGCDVRTGSSLLREVTGGLIVAVLLTSFLSFWLWSGARRAEQVAY